MVGVRKFRETFQDLTEPTEVVKVDGAMTRIGTWYPEKKAPKKEVEEQAGV